MESNDNKTREELIDENEDLRRQLKDRYGLYFSHSIASEDVVKTCIHNIPILERDFEKDVINGLPDNVLIEGDNFHALSALTEIYPNGFVDIIYIDPPYNTGNKDFTYNDRFVDDEDSFRHSKWLSFMEARLNLALSLLKDSGVIFISIDEHEFAQLKLLCDSIFGENNFVENFIWVKNATKNLSKTTSTNHEYILCYAKNKNVVEEKEIFRIKKPGCAEVEDLLEDAKIKNLSIEETETMLSKFYRSRPEFKGVSGYDNVEIELDEETGEKRYRAFTLDNLSAPKAVGKAEVYDLIHPITGKPCKIPSRGWAYKKDKMDEAIKKNLIYFYEDENHVPRYKRYLDNVETDVMKSVIEDFNDGKKELLKIFNGEAPFSNAKPVSLLKKLFAIAGENAIIMDFFAGSGTTGQAVLELNQEDGGNRKFILCTDNQNDIMTEVCYPRLKTVIKGIRADGTKYSDGLSGSIRYYTTRFVEDEDSKDQTKYNLCQSCDGLLTLFDSCFDKYCFVDDKYSIYLNQDKKKAIGIYVDDIHDLFGEMLEKMKELNILENVVYYFSQSSEIDNSTKENVDAILYNAEVKPIPNKIYSKFQMNSRELGLKVK